MMQKAYIVFKNVASKKNDEDGGELAQRSRWGDLVTEVVSIHSYLLSDMLRGKLYLGIENDTRASKNNHASFKTGALKIEQIKTTSNQTKNN